MTSTTTTTKTKDDEQYEYVMEIVYVFVLEFCSATLFDEFGVFKCLFNIENNCYFPRQNVKYSRI